MARARDPDGIRPAASAVRATTRDLPAAAGTHTLHRAAVILAAKGGLVADITVGDVLELLDAEADGPPQPVAPRHRVLPDRCTSWGSSAPAAPTRLRELRSAGQRTPAGADRPLSTSPAGRSATCWWTTCANAQPALDYSSLRALASDLGNVFWKDLERHHPGIDSLHLPPEVAAAWKQRLRTRPKTVTTARRREDRTSPSSGSATASA